MAFFMPLIMKAFALAHAATKATEAATAFVSGVALHAVRVVAPFCFGFYNRDYATLTGETPRVGGPFAPA